MRDGTSRRRVAITGIGVVCPLGSAVADVWEAMLAGRSAVTAREFISAATGTTLTIPAASVPDESLKPIPKASEVMADKFGKLALMAMQDAIADSGISLPQADRTRVGISTGTSMGGVIETDIGFNTIYVQKRPKVHPFTVIKTMFNSPASLLCTIHGLSGPVLSYGITCAASSVAIGEAARQIQHGYADVMIAGGTEAPLTYPAVNSWVSAQLLAPVHQMPAQSCRPFDATRNGTALGEGAAYFVLEEYEQARSRGARILVELVGYGVSTDSGHLTQPSVAGQARPMSLALADAGIAPEAIGYVSAHGTATKRNDATETQAIRVAFGKHAERLAVSSHKSMIGHLVGAAGAVGLLQCVMAVVTEKVPPTANLHTPDPECNLDYVPHVGRALPGLRGAMVNAFGLGGTAASLLVTRPH